MEEEDRVAAQDSSSSQGITCGPMAPNTISDRSKKNLPGEATAAGGLAGATRSTAIADPTHRKCPSPRPNGKAKGDPRERGRGQAGSTSFDDRLRAKLAGGREGGGKHHAGGPSGTSIGFENEARASSAKTGAFRTSEQDSPAEKAASTSPADQFGDGGNADEEDKSRAHEAPTTFRPKDAFDKQKVTGDSSLLAKPKDEDVPTREISPPTAVVSELSPPVPFNAANVEDDDYARTKVASFINRVGVSELSPPAPFNAASIEDDRVQRKVASSFEHVALAAPPTPFENSEDNARDDPNNSDGTNGVVPAANTNMNRIQPYASEDEESPPINDANTLGNLDGTNRIHAAESGPEESPPFNDAHASRIFNRGVQVLASVRPSFLRGANDGSTPFIPEAILVEDGDVIIATELEPQLPWAKQRRTRAFLCIVALLVVIFAVAFGVLASRDGLGDAPPSVSLSGAPSSSSSPSSAPSSCGDVLSSSKQKIDLTGDPFRPVVALDGRSMVVVAQDSRSGATYASFYSLESNIWVIRSVFREDYYSENMLDTYVVSLSGTTALVGISMADDCKGLLSLYEQNQYGYWEKREDVFGPKEHYFGSLGWTVDIDGDMACVGDDVYNYIFRRDGDAKWMQVNKLDSYGSRACHISGDIVALFGECYVAEVKKGTCFQQLYEYDEEQGGVVLLQDKIIADFTSVALNRDHLAVGYDTKEEVIIYRREESNRTFTPQERFNISAQWPRDRLALDGNILVVSGRNHTHIYSEQNGRWEETITMDESYSNPVLSEWALIAISLNDVYSFDIQGCMPEPTQMPTSSLAPTACYSVDITIVHDKDPWDTSWKLQRIGSDGDVTVLWSDRARAGDVLTTKSMCLREGEYEFTIYDHWLYDYDYKNPGHYNVTSNGVLIAEGKHTATREGKKFSLPIAPPSFTTLSLYPTSSPSSSLSPSTILPSASPSATLPPTETCFWVQIVIDYDDYSNQTSWELRKADDSDQWEPNPYILEEGFSAVEGKSYDIFPRCLRQGEYSFTIFDCAGDGMDGHYNITTSNGVLIAEGGEQLAYSETAIFSIPFERAS